MTDNAQVTGTAAPNGVVYTTPDGNGVAPTTPAMPVSDAPAQQQIDWERKLAEREAAWQADLNRMKGSLQSQQAAAEAAYRQREAAYTQRIRELEVSGMDENQRTKYERAMLEQDYQSLQQNYAAMQQQLEAERQRQAYVQAFANMGVPLNALDTSTPQSVIASGWEAVNRQMTELRAQAARASSPAPSPAPSSSPSDMQPPAVVIPGSNVPGGPTWDALIQRYGSMEKVFSLVEQGMLPPSVLPQ